MSVFSSCFSNNAAVMVFQCQPQVVVTVPADGITVVLDQHYERLTIQEVDFQTSDECRCLVAFQSPIQPVERIVRRNPSIIYELHDSETKWSLLVIVSFIFRLQGQCHQYFLLTKHCGTIRLIMVSQLTFISLLRAFTYFFYFHDFIARFDQYQPSRRGSSLNKIMF